MNSALIPRAGPHKAKPRRSVLRSAVYQIAAAFWTAGFLSLAASNSALSAGTLVHFKYDATPGTIVVRTGERRLYLVLEKGQAIQYAVGVGRAGRQWNGLSTIDGKYIEPNWAPPAEIKRDRPSLPDIIPGGSPRNPLGAAAMTLSGGQYAIHGTNAPQSIGGFVSYGCIRMLNEDILDLYARVVVGSLVIVIP